MTPRLRRVATAALLITGLAAAGIVAMLADDPEPLDRCADPVARDAVNVQRQLRSTDAGYELELWSRQAFPVRALPPVLRIGTVDFALSRHPDAGSLNSLVFTISRDDFAAIETGDPVLVHHGIVPEELVADPQLGASVVIADGWDLWTFGLFDKSRLDCPPSALPSD